MKRRVGLALVLLTAWAAALLSLTALVPPISMPCSSDTVVRAPSPSGHIEAVLNENNCGATTSFGYVVSLRAAASSMTSLVPAASAYGAIRNDDAYGMNLVWIDENTVEVQYWKARWATLEHPSIPINGLMITTRMSADVRDEAAPAGGMLYNIERRSAAGRVR